MCQYFIRSIKSLRAKATFIYLTFYFEITLDIEKVAKILESFLHLASPNVTVLYNNHTLI